MRVARVVYGCFTAAAVVAFGALDTTLAVLSVPVTCFGAFSHQQAESHLRDAQALAVSAATAFAAAESAEALSAEDEAASTVDEEQAAAAEAREESDVEKEGADGERAAADEEEAGELEEEAAADESLAGEHKAAVAADIAEETADEARAAEDTAAEGGDAEAAAAITWIPGLDVIGDAVAATVAGALAADAAVEHAAAIEKVAEAAKEAAAAAGASAAAESASAKAVEDQADAAGAEAEEAELSAEEAANEKQVVEDEAEATAEEAKALGEQACCSPPAPVCTPFSPLPTHTLTFPQEAGASEAGSAARLAVEALAAAGSAYLFYVLAGAAAVLQAAIIVPRRALKHGPPLVARARKLVCTVPRGELSSDRLLLTTGPICHVLLWASAGLSLLRLSLRQHSATELGAAGAQIAFGVVGAALCVATATLAHELPLAAAWRPAALHWGPWNCSSTLTLAFRHPPLPSQLRVGRRAAYWASFCTLRLVGHLIYASAVLLLVVFSSIWHRQIFRAVQLPALARPFKPFAVAAVAAVATYVNFSLSRATARTMIEPQEDMRKPLLPAKATTQQVVSATRSRGPRLCSCFCAACRGCGALFSRRVATPALILFEVFSCLNPAQCLALWAFHSIL